MDLQSLTTPAASAASRFWDRFDAWMAWAGEFVNPILVKETRQALKSRQFLAMFTLLLLCGWVWSMCVLFWAPGIYYGAGGLDIFAGYFFILCFPLIVVVPFGAYRSLASEWEDGTYDLMSISTLNARQIVTGKLGSAILQMIVYLSALAPCIAFTYLLRGIDLVTIAWLLFWLCMNSLVGTFLALAVATITRSRAWQVLVSVVLIALCLFNFVMVIAFVADNLGRPYFLEFDDPYFWIGNAAFLTGVVGYSAMFLLIARARLMFPTENRSTALRVTMLVQFGLFAGWWGWAWWTFGPDDEPAYAFFILVAIHWHLMGMFMTGEDAVLSPRVKRDLPQSFLGRAFLTWFNPGSGTGYLFSLTNFAAAAGLGLVAVYAVSGRQIGTATPRSLRPAEVAGMTHLAVFLFYYLVIYLGAGRLLIASLRRRYECNMFAGVMLHLGLFAFGNLAPVLLHLALLGILHEHQFTAFHLPCAIWVLVEAVERPYSNQIAMLHFILPLLALLVAGLNLPSVAREVRQLRVARPQRVEEDEAALHPPASPQPTSPWG